MQFNQHSWKEHEHAELTNIAAQSQVPAVVVMTTMIGGPYFGIPSALIRDGIWKEMLPAEKAVYIALLHESERFHSRELQRTDAELTALCGQSSRALSRARKKLHEHGLIVYMLKSTGYLYVICNPETGQPYPGSPRQAIVYMPAEDFSQRKQQESAKPSLVGGVPLKWN